MINGFEKETADLTEKEMELTRYIAARIQNNVGQDKAVSSAKIIRVIKQNTGQTISGARIRKIINYIRMRGLVINLIATSKGYYIENDPERIKEYVESLRQRAGAINAIADQFEL